MGRSGDPVIARDRVIGKGEGVTIYVELLEEGVPCWRRVEAEELSDGSFRIIGTPTADERWAFQKGDVVQCEQRQFQNGSGLVAYRKVG